MWRGRVPWPSHISSVYVAAPVWDGARRTTGGAKSPGIPWAPFHLSLFSSRFTVLVHDLGQLRVRACHRMWAVRLQVMPADSAGFPGVVLGLPTTIGPNDCSIESPMPVRGLIDFAEPHKDGEESS